MLISETLNLLLSVPVENEVSEGMSQVRVWGVGYLKEAAWQTIGDRWLREVRG